MGPENNKVRNGENDDEDDGGCPDSDDDDDDDSAPWFYKPFKYAGNSMLSVDDEGVEDEDEADLMPTDKTDIGTPETRLSEDARLLCEDPDKIVLPIFLLGVWISWSIVLNNFIIIKLFLSMYLLWRSR